MNFNLGELESLFADIQKIIGYIEYSQYQDREDILYLSNGEKIKYKLLNENIPHLLGINTDYLVATHCFKNTNSFELLKELISNPYKIHNLVQQGILNYNQMFSPFILSKVHIFNFNVKINIFDTELICKYDVTKTYSFTEKNEKFDYVILKKQKYADVYGVLCLVKNNNHYAPISSLYFENYESMKEHLSNLIKNQEVTLLSGEKTRNPFEGYEKQYTLPVDIKINKLTNLQNYKMEFDFIIDTASDFKYLLTDSLKHKNKYFESTDLLQSAINAISSGNLIDSAPFFNSNLYELVKAYNDYLCNSVGGGVTSTGINETYTSVVEERDKLIECLNNLRQEIEDYKIQITQYESANKALQNENNEFRKKEEAILKILKPSE